MQVTDAHLRIFGLARVKKENENRINSLDFHRSEVRTFELTIQCVF